MKITKMNPTASQILLNVFRFFETMKRIENIEVVPFYITYHSLNYDCKYLFSEDSKRVKETLYYCSEEENVLRYIQFGSKPFTCENCPFNK